MTRGEYIMKDLISVKETQEKGLGVFALRDVGKGELRDEEVTFDYSTIVADGWQLECSCGSPRCRKIIGKYRNLPDSFKRECEEYTPDWIRNT